MMSQLCLLAIVLCLPLGCLGDSLLCEGAINNVGGPPRADINNYKAFKYQLSPLGACENAELICEATIIPNSTLRGRTWFVTNIRPNFGLFYDDSVIHDFNVQCPANTYLHLFVQSSSLPGPDFMRNCNGDRVRVGGIGLEGGETTFCGNIGDVEADSELYNLGRGRIFPDGRASISFCSDGVAPMAGEQFDGFVIRASCLDPSEFLLPGCIDFSFTQIWDPGFVNQIFNMFAEVEKVVLPHKKRRSISETLALKQMQRKKRFTDSEKFNLLSGDMVMYNNGELRITFNETGDVRTLTEIGSINAFNPLIGTRVFSNSAPLTFFGPGDLLIDKSTAILTNYTIPDEMVESIFLPGRVETDVANIIYEHIFNNWIFAYPVIDKEERRMNALPIFPLPPGSQPPQFPDLDFDGYRSAAELGFIQEDIQSGNCKRALRIDVAPSNNARMPPEIVRFCQYFHNSCDYALRTACREALRLDPRSVGK